VTYYCWHCYAANRWSRRACVGCGEEVAAPAGTDYVALLIWSLGHPLPERRMIAAQVLGQRREPRARERLLELALEAADPYLAAQALSALIAIDGSPPHRALLQRLAKTGPTLVKHVARAALVTSEGR
jgi:HEAT repeats